LEKLNDKLVITRERFDAFSKGKRRAFKPYPHSNCESAAREGGCMRQHRSMNQLIPVLSVLLIGVSAIKAQTPPNSPLLTEQEAVEMAQSSNRKIQASALNIDIASQAIWEAKTSYLPQTNIQVSGGRHIGDVTFTLPKGILGSYAATGLIPGRNIDVNGGKDFTDHNSGSISQPLSQFYAIHLSVEIARNSRALAEETLRQQHQSVADQARQAYHQICLLEAAIDADQSQEKSLEELSRVAENNVIQGTALKADSLQAESALTQLLYAQEKDEDAVVSAKEQLNRLLARDVDTPFEVEPLPAVSEEEESLAIARATALQQRPEIRLAKLQIDKANLSIHEEKAGYIPNISAQVTYQGFQGEVFLPKNDASAGFSLQWQNPWDWGNRRAKIKALRDEGKQQTLSSEDTSQQVLIDVDQKFRALKESRLLVTAALAAKDASAESLRNVSNQFRQHTALLSDVLNQAANDRKQSEAYTQALAAYWTARANFDLALGRN
jgi:outer membrane protein TolC